jgi:UDP-3-O-acyl-N-acetylglucosamine deacetylase
MADSQYGTILEGDPEILEREYAQWRQIPVDQECDARPATAPHSRPHTIQTSTAVSGPGTFSGTTTRTIRLEPTDRPGWWIDRSDLPHSRPIKVSIRNVWTTGGVVSNIVLRSGSPRNYFRMAEHLIALRAGLDIDNLLIRVESGDPPLFERGSLDLVEALESAGRREVAGTVRYFTVRERVTIAGRTSGFLTLSPAASAEAGLRIDCTRDFANAIGIQRIRFAVSRENVRYGSVARTNTTNRERWFCATVGKLFADLRNLGYNRKNVLVAGKRRYINEPRLLHDGKSLEAAWHRAVLDLLAGIALIEEGRFVGDIVCYKGGHYGDIEAVKLLYANDMLVEV